MIKIWVDLFDLSRCSEEKRRIREENREKKGWIRGWTFCVISPLFGENLFRKCQTIQTCKVEHDDHVQYFYSSTVLTYFSNSLHIFKLEFGMPNLLRIWGIWDFGAYGLKPSPRCILCAVTHVFWIRLPREHHYEKIGKYLVFRAHDFWTSKRSFF